MKPNGRTSVTFFRLCSEESVAKIHEILNEGGLVSFRRSITTGKPTKCVHLRKFGDGFRRDTKPSPRLNCSGVYHRYYDCIVSIERSELIPPYRSKSNSELAQLVKVASTLAQTMLMMEENGIDVWGS